MIQTLHSPFSDNVVDTAVLRLDLLHAGISGNKWFKLKFYLAQATAEARSGILSFGGAYSNHLVAMGFACRQAGLKATAFIRGNDPNMNNPSLQQMRQLGMELVFVGREAYRNKDELAHGFLQHHPGHLVIPEGGQGDAGIRGAAEIAQLIHTSYTDIICAVGTGTTMAGLVNGVSPSQRVTGICCLKTSSGADNELLHYLGQHTIQNNYRLLFNYHFGGYAKKTDELIGFMNQLHAAENIPTDFVYTGKLFYAVHDLIQKGYFPPGSKLLIVHSGGLQGNQSLPGGVLKF